MEITEALNRIYLGRSVAFFGAGFSIGAKGLNNKPLQDATDVAKEISKLANEDELPLDLATDIYIQNGGTKNEIIDLLKSQFFVTMSKPFHNKVACLPWQRIYTTNYDNLIETCRRQSGLPTDSKTLSDRPSNGITVGSIIHFNGFIEKLNSQNWDTDMILATSDYFSGKVADSDWAQIFRQDCTLADSIFFFGYSMYDLDIGRILYQNPDIISKSFFIVGENPKRATQIKAKMFGSVIEENVCEFSEKIPGENDNCVVRESAFWAAFTPITIDPSHDAPDTEKVQSFLAKGDADRRFISRSILEGLPDYYIAREGLTNIIETAETTPARYVLHSDLGNGKSQAVEEITVMFKTAGYQCLSFSGSLSGLENDFAVLQKLTTSERRKLVFIFEDGLSFGTSIKQMLADFPEISIIITVRSAVLQTRSASPSDILGGKFMVIDLNGLTDDESEEFNNLLYAHGLWGEKQGWSQKKRATYISKECNKRLSSLLISVCTASQIYDKLKVHLSNIEDANKQVIDALITTLALAYAGQNINISQLSEILQNDLFKLGKNQNDELLREFIEFDRGVVTVKSPIFAQSVLKKLVPDHVIISSIPYIVARLDRLGLNNVIFDKMKRRLMRFRFIEQILNDDQKDHKLVNFYEKIRGLGIGTSDPQFWLQYAIARMSFKDYEKASSNFDSALGLAQNRTDYDPFQIENHYARFLIESRTETNLWDDYFSAWLRAHEIMKSQFKKLEEARYTFRVASKYLSFIESRNSELSKEELIIVKNACQDLINISKNIPHDNINRQYRSEFDQNMRATIDYIDETN